MAPADLKPGDHILRGLLYRRIPNTELSFDYRGNKPGNVAFRPDVGETGISAFLAQLARPEQILDGFPGYGLCEFTAEDFLAEVRRLRENRDNRFDQEVKIIFDPSRGDANTGHAHCYIEPVPPIIQKALYKRLAKMTPGCNPGPPVAGRSSQSGGVTWQRRVATDP